jgi:hypothetical protein
MVTAVQILVYPIRLLINHASLSLCKGFQTRHMLDRHCAAHTPFDVIKKGALKKKNPIFSSNSILQLE